MMGLEDLFSQTEDQPIPGGCGICDAFQVVETIRPGFVVIHVSHDSWCPILRAIEAGSN
jgi:hypothetical protein